MNQRPRTANLTVPGHVTTKGLTTVGLTFGLTLGLALSGCGVLDPVQPSATPPEPPAPIETATGGTISTNVTKPTVMRTWPAFMMPLPAPVMAIQPRSAMMRLNSTQAAKSGWSSGVRAEPKIVTLCGFS